MSLAVAGPIESSIDEYTEAVEVVMETLAELRRMEAHLKAVNDDYSAKLNAFHDRRKAAEQALREDVGWRVRAVQEDFEEEFRRTMGRYMGTAKARAKFMGRNAARIKRATNAVIAELKTSRMGNIGASPEPPDFSSLHDGIKSAKADLEDLRELAADYLFSMMGDVFTTPESLSAERDPHVARFYRGTNLTRFVMAPHSLWERDRRVKVLDFAPGIYEGVQCFSADGDIGTGLSFALEPWTSHGMNLQDNHPYAVIMELGIYRSALQELERRGSMRRTGRSDEMLFDNNFLTQYGRFRIFNPYAFAQ